MTSSLLFPQWQGSGSPHARSLQEGAEQIAELFDKAPVRVDLTASEELEIQRGIGGRAQLLQQLETATAMLAQTQPEHLFTIGGDCGVDLAPASHLNAQHDSLALVWLDAHADLNTPASSPSGAFHGMILRTLLGEGDPDFLAQAFSIFSPEQVFLAGARDFDPPERAFAEGLVHLSVDDLEHQPRVLAKRIAAGGFDKLHIHLDLDVLDPGGVCLDGLPDTERLIHQRTRATFKNASREI